jgi:hypothetical protein|tara:strand:- start:87 stop:227 length:141 start_codon:yes stop_codon:yes gene_type:complete
MRPVTTATSTVVTAVLRSVVRRSVATASWIRERAAMMATGTLTMVV